MINEDDQLIHDFLNGLLSEVQIKEVEQRMHLDSIFREKILIEKQLFETLNPNDWSFAENVNHQKKETYSTIYNSKEATDFKQTLIKVNSEYQNSQKNTSKKTIRKFFYPVAAAILIIGGLIFMYPKKENLKDVYASSINFSELPSMVVRSESESKSTLIKAQNAFEAKDYKNALVLISSQEKVIRKQRGVLLLYKGISQMELEDYDTALKTFDSLSTSNFIDAPKGIWYKALLFLKKGDKKAARIALEKIISNPNHYKYEKAKEILKKL